MRLSRHVCWSSHLNTRAACAVSAVYHQSVCVWWSTVKNLVQLFCRSTMASSASTSSVSTTAVASTAAVSHPTSLSGVLLSVETILNPIKVAVEIYRCRLPCHPLPMLHDHGKALYNLLVFHFCVKENTWLVLIQKKHTLSALGPEAPPHSLICV